MTLPPFPKASIGPALIATAAVAVVGTWLTVGSLRYAQVNLTWNPDMSRAARDYEARKHALRFVRDDGENVWVYTLEDTSKRNIAAIFAIPGVRQVRFLDRTTLTPQYQTTSPLQWLNKYGYLERWRLGQIVRPAGLVPVAILTLLLALVVRREGRAWLVARIPRASPASMGVFRIAFAVALIPLVNRTVPASMPVPHIVCLVSLALFGAGALGRLSFIVFTVVFIVAHWGEVGNHEFALPVRTLLLLTLVPWGDGFSVDEMVRRLRGRATPPTPARRYGLAMWIPIFTLGSAYAAAAFAKLDQGAKEWLFQGAARYFFAVDGRLFAPGTLWQAVAVNDRLTVVLSVGAVLTEAGIITAALWPRPIVRFVAGVGATLLHLGFWYLQGQWWYGWWALLVAFVPWDAAVERCRRYLPHLTIAVPDQSASCQRLANRIRAFDWFDCISLTRVSADSAGSLKVFATDGTPVEPRFPAYVYVLSVLPIAWPLLPLLWAARTVVPHPPAVIDGPGAPIAATAASGPENVLTIGRTERIPRIAAAALVLVALQQPIVSLLIMDYPPFVSNYPMYAHVNWHSKEEFAAEMDRDYQPSAPAIRLVPADGSDPGLLETRLRALDAWTTVEESARVIDQGGTLDSGRIARLHEVAARYREMYGGPLPRLRMLTASWRFDWTVANFVPARDWTPRQTFDLTALDDTATVK